jgi:hypothetical protein
VHEELNILSVEPKWPGGQYCITDGIGNHGSGEAATMTVAVAGMLYMKGVFRTEGTQYDYLTIKGVKYGGTTPPPSYLVLSVGEILTWRTDGSSERAGFTLCICGPGDILTGPNECTPSTRASSTTRTTAVAGCASQSAFNLTSDCDMRGGGTLVVHAMDAGCALGTPRPIITIGDSLICGNVSAPSSGLIPDPSCTIPTIAQVFTCTMPTVPTALLGTPLAVRVKWHEATNMTTFDGVPVTGILLFLQSH